MDEVDPSEVVEKAVETIVEVVENVTNATANATAPVDTTSWPVWIAKKLFMFIL